MLHLLQKTIGIYLPYAKQTNIFGRRMLYREMLFSFPINLTVLKYLLPRSSKVDSLSVWQPTPSP